MHKIVRPNLVCTLKHTSQNYSKRPRVGLGLRLAPRLATPTAVLFIPDGPSPSHCLVGSVEVCPLPAASYSARGYGITSSARPDGPVRPTATLLHLHHRAIIRGRHHRCSVFQNLLKFSTLPSVDSSVDSQIMFPQN